MILQANQQKVMFAQTSHSSARGWNGMVFDNERYIKLDLWWSRVSL